MPAIAPMVNPPKPPYRCEQGCKPEPPPDRLIREGRIPERTLYDPWHKCTHRERNKTTHMEPENETPKFNLGGCISALLGIAGLIYAAYVLLSL